MDDIKINLFMEAEDPTKDSAQDSSKLSNNSKPDSNVDKVEKSDTTNKEAPSTNPDEPAPTDSMNPPVLDSEGIKKMMTKLDAVNNLAKLKALNQKAKELVIINKNIFTNFSELLFTFNDIDRNTKVFIKTVSDSIVNDIDNFVKDSIVFINSTLDKIKSK